MLPTEFSCYCVTKDAAGNVCGRMATRPLDELPPGDVLVRVVYSSLNYKDALAVKGHPGVTKKYPHVPGVDAAGVVAESGVYEFVEGDRVLVTGFDMGRTAGADTASMSACRKTGSCRCRPGYRWKRA